MARPVDDEKGCSVKTHLSNAVYGVLDYTAYPIGMLLTAPVLLRHLGTTEYGLWALATAVVSTGSIIASGFGDANIQYVAKARSCGDIEAVGRAVRGTMGINLLLGVVLALISWILVPHVIGRIVSSNPGSQYECLWSLRVASLLILVRAIESVCISTQRAFERYGAAIRISVLARMLTLLAAVPLAYLGMGVVGIMVGTGVLITVGTIAQLVRLHQHLGTTSLLPSFDRSATTALFSFGIFSWLQAVSGVVFTQVDRLMLGVSLGATAVTAYVLCVQMAQPIYGIAAAGLHFLFPHLAGLQTTAKSSVLKEAVVSALAFNVAFVAVAATTVLLFGHAVLYKWVGASIAEKSVKIFAPIVWGFALMGLNVTGYYSMLALGRVRTVTMLGVVGGATMVSLMVLLLPNMGIMGLVVARLSYGAISLFVYLFLPFVLRSKNDSQLSGAAVDTICEDV
jgi:O-antigen/teichoic acid export membrane protein